jgi:crotonobetainyl-CoA:carnitine CoA-transferase CaiB-like acyl-CoA transferase
MWRFCAGRSKKEKMEQVLKNIRVLDFGRFIAAPWCSAILGDMGADVIRIEKREGGEDRWVQPVTPAGDGATFLQCNRNKRSLTLDSTTPEGAEITRKLVSTADIVIANMPDQAMRANGLDYDSLKAVKPDIILTCATAYGNGGPYSDRVGFDGIGQVMSGGVYRSGTADHPMRSAVPYVDFGTAMNLAIGTMMALYHRRNTGQGQRVEAALLPTALAMTNAMIIEQDLLQVNRVAVGNRGVAVAPCDLFKLSDGWILVQVAGQPMFKRWCRLVGQPELFDDPRFGNDDMRSNHVDYLNGVMQAWCDGKTKAEALAALDAARMPASALYSPQEALDDPHVRAMGFFKPLDYPGLKKPAPVIETPFRMSLTPGSIHSRAPALGEHTETIMAELGYSAAEIAGLRERAII